MNLSNFLADCQQRGVTLTVTDGTEPKIKAKFPPGLSIPHDFVPYLRSHKFQIIQALQNSVSEGSYTKPDKEQSILDQVTGPNLIDTRDTPIESTADISDTDIVALSLEVEELDELKARARSVEMSLNLIIGNLEQAVQQATVDALPMIAFKLTPGTTVPNPSFWLRKAIDRARCYVLDVHNALHRRDKAMRFGEGSTERATMQVERSIERMEGTVIDLDIFKEWYEQLPTPPSIR